MAGRIRTSEYVPQYLSRKLRVLSFVTMIMVVIVHAYNYADSMLHPTTLIAEGMHSPALIEFFFSNGITNFANPLFFCISGYLLFAGVKKYDVDTYVYQVKKRIKTLAVPYIIWVLFWTGISAVLLAAAGWEPFPLLQEKLGSCSDIGSVILRFFVDPVSFQFWFLRDLFKLVLLSPVFYFLAKYLRAYSLLLFIVPGILNINIMYMPESIHIQFFMAGVYAAVSGAGQRRFSRPVKNKALLLIPVCWVVLCLFYTYLSGSGNVLFASDIAMTVIHRTCMVFGVASVFLLYDFILGNDDVKGKRLWRSPFMIFALHEPVQDFIFQYILIDGGSDAAHLLLFFMLPACFVIFGIMADKLLSAYAPKLKLFLTGGR